jgi:hypothetical protein
MSSLESEGCCLHRVRRHYRTSMTSHLIVRMKPSIHFHTTITSASRFAVILTLAWHRGADITCLNGSVRLLPCLSLSRTPIK